MEGATKLKFVPFTPIEYAIAWHHFLPKGNFSDFGRKPRTIVRGFDQNRAHFRWYFCSLEGAMNLKFVPICSP